MAGLGFGDTGSSFVDAHSHLDCDECLLFRLLDGKGILGGQRDISIIF